MNLSFVPFEFVFLTECLCGGADNQAPDVDPENGSPDDGTGAPAELRPPSIRGQIRMWHRALANPATVNRIWGATEGSNAGASRVKLELSSPFMLGERPSQILPHCSPSSQNGDERRKGRSYRNAIAADPGKNYVLILKRLPLCSCSDWESAQHAVKLWLLLGGLGLRCNRAAGSVWPVGAWGPVDENALKATLQTLGYAAPVHALDASVGANARDLREAASDTMNGLPLLFGGVNFWIPDPKDGKDIKVPRKASPARFKVGLLSGSPRLLVTWLDEGPHRQPPSLPAVEAALYGKKLGSKPWQAILS